ALMCGNGSNINGSYMGYSRVFATNVVPIETRRSSKECAVTSPSYATAWTSLNRALVLAAGQTLGIRRATSAQGQAALNSAVQAGAQIITTARRRERVGQMAGRGAQRMEIEGPDLSEGMPERKRIDAVLDRVGNSTLLDSLSMVRRGGRVCQSSFLGGRAPSADLTPLLQLPSGVRFSYSGSVVFGTPDVPCSDVLLLAIVGCVAAGRYKATPVAVLRLEDSREAQRVMEANRASGKLAVHVEGVPL